MRIFAVLLVFALLSCDYIKPKEKEEEIEDRLALARVGENYLYEEDLRTILIEATNAEDSTNIRDRYVNSWIKRQLMLSKAEELVEFNQTEIERKTQEYRYALISFEFKKKFIEENLDKEVSEEEIQAYYQENLDNFLLNQNIIKCRYVQVPLDAPRINNVKRLIRSEKPKDQEELSSYCFQFASNFNLEDSVWLNFDDIVLNSPLKSIPNKINFLKTNKMVETQDSVFKYLLFIKEYKILDQLSPLEFVQDQIQSIIINKRKVVLTKELEERIYKEAIVENKFEVFEN